MKGFMICLFIVGMVAIVLPVDFKFTEFHLIGLGIIVIASLLAIASKKRG